MASVRAEWSAGSQLCPWTLQPQPGVIARRLWAWQAAVCPAPQNRKFGKEPEDSAMSPPPAGILSSPSRPPPGLPTGPSSILAEAQHVPVPS